MTGTEGGWVEAGAAGGGDDGEAAGEGGDGGEGAAGDEAARGFAGGEEALMPYQMMEEPTRIRQANESSIHPRRVMAVLDHDLAAWWVPGNPIDVP
ncbi:hypothetical protein AB0M46_16195 [Dactylosporangium sp. NPDC051485]|uniref:hypothetical protein n=1 Tax=Dactylosporangium sp. NPDC051485 TaxID=3154846 RepID=UPI00341BD1D1